MNKYDKYDKRSDESHGVLNRGLVGQVLLKGIIPGWYPQEGKDILELTPGNTTWEIRPYVKHQDESRPKVNMNG